MADFRDLEAFVRKHWSDKATLRRMSEGDPTDAFGAEGDFLLHSGLGKVYYRLDGRWEQVYPATVTVSGVDANGDPVAASAETIAFDGDTGLLVTETGEGQVEVSLGSHYRTVQVPGWDPLVAQGEDTLNLSPGTGIVIETDPDSDTLTFRVDPNTIDTSGGGSASLEPYPPVLARPSYPNYASGSVFYEPGSSSPEETKATRIIDKGYARTTPSDGQPEPLSEGIEGDVSPSYPATPQESDKVRITGKGQVKPSPESGDQASLQEAVEAQGNLYQFPRTKATSQEADTLWLADKGEVTASPSDRDAADLFNKIETGRGLNAYRTQVSQSEESEALRICLDDEVQGVVDTLKYEQYVKRTEQHRSNDLYVDARTAPYISVRDGSATRPYLTIKEAVESEQAQRGDCTIWVRSGLYIEEAPISLPPGTSVIGSELRRCRVYPTTDTCGASYDRNGGGTYLFEVTHDCIVRNFTVRGVVASGFTFGFVEGADLKTISPYIQNVTSYNDGRDVHQLFDLGLSALQPKLLPNGTAFSESIRVIPRDGTHPDYDPNASPQPPVLEVEREVEKPLRLALGEVYTFTIANGDSQWLRFTQDLSSYDRVSFASETADSSTLDLTSLTPKQRDTPLYYVLFPNAIEGDPPSWGKVDLYSPNQYEDDYVLRPGDKASEVEVDPLPLNLERGDAVYVGDPGSFPFTELNQSLRAEISYSQLAVRVLNKRLSAGETVYISNGETTLPVVLANNAQVGDTVLNIEPVKSQKEFTVGASIHYQHPRWTQRFVLVEDAPKGTSRLKVGTFETIAESNTLAYELTNTKEVPPYDTIPLNSSLDRSYNLGDELWLLETRNDRPTTNHFPVAVKEAAEIGDGNLRVTDAYCRDSPRDLLKIQRLLPLPGNSPVEDQKPVCRAYIRAGASVVKDPLQRRNAGGGAHVDGFRLAEKTRLSFDPPISRLMEFNDFTQVNVNGYGILAEGIANAECVSVFTYFCNNGLYSRNGGEIRALNCSSGFGVYGVKAEGYLGRDPNKSDPNTPEITAEQLWIGYRYNQTLADGNSDPLEATGDLLNKVGVVENPEYNPTQEETTAEPKVGSLIRTNGGEVAGIVQVARFVRADGNVFVEIVIGDTWNAIGSDTPSKLTPMGDLNDPNNRDGIYEFRSVVRMTGHDFGYVGTGTRLPRNVGGSGEPVTENETKTLDFGQVFWSASDQLGNFTVGEFFRVDQSTGKVSFNTDQFDLTGISELGPFRDSLDNSVGVKMREISADPELASERDGRDVNPGPNTVPTQTAVKTYVDQRVGAVIDVQVYYVDGATVVMNGSGGEVFGSIQVLKGLTYRFEIVPADGVSPGPFNIVYESGGLVPASEGATNNGATTGNVLYTVPFDAPEKVYYRIGDQSIQDPDQGKSTFYIRNPDIRFPGGSQGALQYKDVDSSGKAFFAGNDNLTVVGNTLTGSFDGIFSGDGQFLKNITVNQSLRDIVGVDLGVNQTKEGDTLAFFGGTQDQEAEWRLARPYLPLTLNNGATASLPVRYNYKEGTPEVPFTPGKLDFTIAKGSVYAGVI